MVTRVFRDEGGGLKEIRPVSGGFDNEKDMQDTIQRNLNTILPNHDLVDAEFHVGGLRVDTVAFDTKTRSFVIIEYKNIKRGGAIDQGMAYLQLLDENKADFLQCYQQSGKGNKNLKVDDIEWGESKVVVIAPAFTKHQLYAAKRTRDPIELYRITKYADKIITLEKAAGQDQKTSESAGGQYSEKAHMDTKASKETKMLYDKLKQEVGKVVGGDIEVKPRDTYIKIHSAINDKALCTVAAKQKSLDLCYITKRLDIAEEDAKSEFVKHMINPDGRPKGKAGLGDYLSKIENDAHILRAMKYIKQVHTQEN